METEAENAQRTTPLPARAPRKRSSGCCMGCSRRLPFFLAVDEGDASEVIRFLQEDVLYLRRTDLKDKRTAWHLAAEKGHVEVLRALVSRTREDDVGSLWGTLNVVSFTSRIMSLARDIPGPDERVAELVNVRSAWGISPLTLAAMNEQEEATRYLLSLGADPWLGDHDGRNPVHYAAKAGAVKGLQVLLEQERPFSSRACNHNRPSTRYVDSLDSFGFTPLHYATWANRRSAMMTLIGFDANIIARSLLLHSEYYNLPAGSTPLHVACLLGDLERVKLLLRAYYETAADLLPSQTAMMGTVERRRRARSHPDPRLILTRTQRLPFHIAARCGHRHLLDWLDPSVPLMFLFGGEEDIVVGPDGSRVSGTVATVGVSRLTVIAAKALHQALLDSLDAAAEDIRRHEEAARAREEERQRRREERRTAREAAAAAQSLKQGKEPPPEGIRGKIRRLMDRASRDNVNTSSVRNSSTRASAGGVDAAASTAETGTCAANTGSSGGGAGWRPWRARSRRTSHRRKPTGSTAADASATSGSEEQGPTAVRSPRRRRRRTGGGVAAAASGVRGGARTAATAAAAEDAAAGKSDGNSSSDSDDSICGRAQRDTQQRRQKHKKEKAVSGSPPLQPPMPTLSPVTSLRRRVLADGGGAASSAQPSRISLNGGGVEGAADASNPTSLTRSVLQRLTLRRRPSSTGPGTAARAEAQAQAHLDGRLNRAGVTIPESPDEEVALFSPPRYNMPTQIVLPVASAPAPALAQASASAPAQAPSGTDGGTDAPVAAAMPGAPSQAATAGPLPGGNQDRVSSSLLTDNMAASRPTSSRDGTSSQAAARGDDAAGTPRNADPDPVAGSSAPQHPAGHAIGLPGVANGEGRGGDDATRPLHEPSCAGAPTSTFQAAKLRPPSASPAGPRAGAGSPNPGPLAVVGLDTIRSMESPLTSPVGAIQPSLPGATESTTLSQQHPALPAPGRVPVGRQSGSGVVAPPAAALPGVAVRGVSASSRRSSSAQLFENLPQLGDQPTEPEPDAAAPSGQQQQQPAVPALAEEPGSSRRSTGVSRMGAGARMLLTSLRNTLRRTSGNHQVLPEAPSGQRARGSAAGQLQTPRSPAQQRVEEERLQLPPLNSGNTDTASTDAAAAPATPTTPGSPTAPYRHGHNGRGSHGGSRGVRVVSGQRPRLSVLGRANVASSVDGSVGRGRGAAFTRRSHQGLSPGRLAASSPAGRIRRASVGGEVNGGQVGLAGSSGGAMQGADGEERQGPAAPQSDQPTAGPGATGNGGGVKPGEGTILQVEDCSSFSSSTVSTLSGGRTASAGAPGGAAPGNDEEDVCPVCLDESPNLLVQACRHQICMDCARDLVKRHSLTPALCPYCRGIISSFRARVAVAVGAVGGPRTPPQ